MNVSLSPDLETFVQNEIGSGVYQTASEVVRAGLRRLRRDQEECLPVMPGTRDELEAQLLCSIDAIDRGEGVDAEAVFRRIGERVKVTPQQG